MLIRRRPDLAEGEITPRELYEGRRRFLRGGAAAALGLGLGVRGAEAAGRRLEGVTRGPYATDEKQTPYEDVTRYNNFYEFSTDKEGPARLSGSFRTQPWQLAVEGEVAKPRVYDIEDVLRRFALEERVYRLRCVEAWSMVIPWIGFPLAALLKEVEPNSRARFVEFTTLLDPEQFPGQRGGLFASSLPWPYVEGLRLDEAMHPLTILSVGLYGEVLPNQNGAPIRLVVPWKYGFKSIKSIVRIRLLEQRPVTTWHRVQSAEYGFYANVNPEVDHPRWSQKRERRIGELFKRPTQMFNGYAGQVAGLYRGMDLARDY